MDLCKCAKIWNVSCSLDGKFFVFVFYTKSFATEMFSFFFPSFFVLFLDELPKVICIIFFLLLQMRVTGIRLLI